MAEAQGTQPHTHHENAEKATREGTETLQLHHHHQVSTEEAWGSTRRRSGNEHDTTRSAERHGHANTAPGAHGEHTLRERERGGRQGTGQSQSGHLPLKKAEAKEENKA